MKFWHTSRCDDSVKDNSFTRRSEDIMEKENTNWAQSVAGVVIKEGKVLLGRHTYGSGNGKLIIPGGYLNVGETPEAAMVREVLEETNVVVEPQKLIGIRFNDHDWYIIFTAKYISGEAKPGDEENSEVVWMDIMEALSRDDVPDLTKRAIESSLAAITSEAGLVQRDYICSAEPGTYSYYGI